MKFLEKLDFKTDYILVLEEDLPELLVDALNDNKKLVIQNLSYLKDLNITNYQEIFFRFTDMFLMDHSNFCDIFEKYEPQDLIEKLKQNIDIVKYL